jgi:hypothetical protein
MPYGQYTVDCFSGDGQLLPPVVYHMLSQGEGHEPMDPLSVASWAKVNAAHCMLAHIIGMLFMCLNT